MTDTGRAGRSRRETNPALADDAARLLDRLRNEPLPDSERTAAALRQATRHAFILVEETRKLAGADTPAPAATLPPLRKNTKDRPFFFDSNRPAKAGEDRECIDLQTFRERVGLEVAIARTRA